MVKNFLWDFLGKFSSQFTSLIVSILLTRLLKPEEYGIMGMAMVLIAVSSVFLNLGFSSAIIQRQEVTRLQLSTVFYLNLFFGLLLFFACFNLAGVVADFYDQPMVKPVFRVLSVSFIVNALTLVPSSLLYKQMSFKQASYFSLIATVSSGFIGIWMAYNGYGVWSLALQSVSAGFFNLILIQSYIRFYPAIIFNLRSVLPLWKYGSKLFLSGILDTVFTRLDIFIIGKIFTPATLGLYTRAQTLDVFVRQMSSGSIASVVFPYFSKHQNDRQFVEKQYSRYLKMIMFLSVGIGGLLYVIANDLFVFLFSERWSVSGGYFRIMALAVFVWPLSNLMCTMISAMGNSGAFLKLEVLKKLLFIPVYAIGFIWGLDGFIYCFVGSLYFALWLNMIFVSKEIQCTVRRQVFMIIPYFVCSVIATVGTKIAIGYYLSGAAHLYRLLAFSVLFLLLYLMLCKASRLTAIVELNNYFQKALKNIYDKRN